MNRLEMEREVLKTIGSFDALGSFLQPTNYVQRWINRALNYTLLVAMRAGASAKIFPVLSVTWKAQTSHEIAYVPLPSNALFIERLYSFDKTGVTNVDREKSRFVSYVSPEQYELLDKTTATKDGFPRQWTRKAARLYVWPIPVTAKLTDLHLHGVKKESALTQDGSEPVMPEELHGLVVLDTCRRFAMALNQPGRAKEFGDAFTVDLRTLMDAGAWEETTRDEPLSLAHVLTEEDVYA